jgi:hypothetical protein
MASNTTTVKRMKSLLPSVSIPRDAASANHEGLIHEPLQNRIRQTWNMYHTILTLYRKSRKHTQLMEDNRVPSTRDHTCTTDAEEAV